MAKYICANCDTEWDSRQAILMHGCRACQKDNKKFMLEFDEPPALVFVQERGSNKVKVYQDGKELHGVRSIDINATAGKITTHTVEYITGHTDIK
jgi:predicted  nucleic acid-binding Zn-ribbon protein